MPTKVRPSLNRYEAILASGRARARARKYPFAWYCTVCDDAYGAGRTEQDAQAQADAHDAAHHPNVTKETTV